MPVIRRVLVAPLDWGLGHATRCIPIIKELIEKGHIVFIGASGQVKELLKMEFPDLEIIFPIHRNPLVRDAITPSIEGLRNVTVLEPLAYGAFSRLMARSCHGKTTT